MDPESSPPENKTRKSFTVGLILIVLVMLGLAGGLGYTLGSQTVEIPESAIPTETAVVLPKDATLTAECVEHRGKQYILPADIPTGPIYDVQDGKVVGIEYLVSLQELTTNPDKFKELGTNGAYDHIELLSTDPHAGFEEQHFHLIIYLISKDQAQSITCSSDSGEPHGH